jgi:hypothetical protein
MQAHYRNVRRLPELKPLKWMRLLYPGAHTGYPSAVGTRRLKLVGLMG